MFPSARYGIMDLKLYLQGEATDKSSLALSQSMLTPFLCALRWYLPACLPHKNKACNTIVECYFHGFDKSSKHWSLRLQESKFRANIREILKRKCNLIMKRVTQRGSRRPFLAALCSSRCYTTVYKQSFNLDPDMQEGSSIWKWKVSSLRTILLTNLQHCDYVEKAE